MARVLEKLQTQQTLLLSHTAICQRAERALARVDHGEPAHHDSGVSRTLPYIQLVYNQHDAAGRLIAFGLRRRVRASTAHAEVGATIIPPRTTIAGNAPEDLFEINVEPKKPAGGVERATTRELLGRELASSSDVRKRRTSARAVQRGRKAPQQALPGERGPGPCTVTKINNNDYEVRNKQRD